MALQKRGKTTFAFGMPKKGNKQDGLAYLQLDNNYEHALKKARSQYGKTSIHHLSYSATNPKDDLQAGAKARWERFIKDYDYCVSHFPSVIVDTMSELYELRRVAEHGRTTGIVAIFYGGIYSDFRWMVRHALENNSNVLFLHRMGDEYVKNERTGNLKLAGWGGIAYESQMLLEHTRDEENHFLTTVREATSDAMLIGMEFSSHPKTNDNTFADLAAAVYPESAKGDWK